MGEYGRYKRCKNTLELVNIFKKSVKYVRNYINEPYNRNPELVDCDVIDSGEGSSTVFSYPYHTKTSLRINKYNYFDNQKLGTFHLLFWTGIRNKEQLRIDGVEESVEIIKEMVDRREEKCHEIAKHTSTTSTASSHRQTSG